jgi:hypothetical protein
MFRAQSVSAICLVRLMFLLFRSDILKMFQGPWASPAPSLPQNLPASLYPHLSLLSFLAFSLRYQSGLIVTHSVIHKPMHA